jgi:hypothetical protein
VAAIVGEGGVGKSRLVYEFTLASATGLARARERLGLVQQATSYLPVIDLLKGYFKIQDQDDLRRSGR